MVYTMEYTVRIHEQDLDGWRQRVVEVIKNIPGEVFMVREVEAQRPHYQAYLRTTLKRGAITVRMKNALPEIKGNKCYSVGEKGVRDRGAYLRYLCKGKSVTEGPEVVLRCGLEFTDVWVANEHKAYWEENKKLKNSEKRKRLGLMDQLRDFAATLPHTESDHRQAIAEHYVQLCIEIDKPINVYYARQVINTVCARLYRSYARELVEAIVEKM